jgi:hypothetical protein
MNREEMRNAGRIWKVIMDYFIFRYAPGGLKRINL